MSDLRAGDRVRITVEATIEESRTSANFVIIEYAGGHTLEIPCASIRKDHGATARVDKARTEWVPASIEPAEAAL